MFRALIVTAIVLCSCVPALAATPTRTRPLPIVRPHIYTASKPIHPEYPQNFTTTYGYYKSTVLWPSKTIDVCWNETSTDFNRNIFDEAVVQAAVEQTWSHFSPIHFTDWQPCPNGKTVGPDSLGITINDVNPGSYGLGTEINQNANAVVFDFTYQKWAANDLDGTPCKNDPTHRLHCDAIIAVHEFGHLLGLSHEQNRPDTPIYGPNGNPICTADPQGENGDTTVGAWDLDSVMNYCNPQWNGDGNLSEGDVATIEHMYGDPFPQPPAAFVQTGSSEVMQTSYGSGTLGELDMALPSGSDVVQDTLQGGTWQHGPTVTTQFLGTPQLLQTNYGIGVHPNFEMLVRQGTQLVEYWRNDLDPALPWQFGGVVASGATAGYAFTQNPNGNGNLEAFYSAGGAVVHLERVAAPGGFVWNQKPVVVSSGVNDIAVARMPSGSYVMVVNQGLQVETFTSADGLSWKQGSVIATDYAYNGLALQVMPSGGLALIANVTGGTYLFTLAASSSASSGIGGGHTTTTCTKPTAAPSVPGTSPQTTTDLPPMLGGPHSDCVTTYVGPKPQPTGKYSVHVIGGSSPAWVKTALVSSQPLTSVGLAVSNIGGGRLEVVGSLGGPFVHFVHPANTSGAAFTRAESIQ